VVGVIVGVPVAAISAAIYAFANHFGLTASAFVAWALSWLTAVGRFFTVRVGLSVWVLCVWGLLTLAMCWMIVRAVLALRLPNTPQYRYRADIFDGLKWRWSVNANNKVFNPQMFCPKCDAEFGNADFQIATPSPTGAVFRAVCRRRDYSANVPPLHTLYARARREAERNIRNVDWKRRPKVG
jgi:hypothetical protein